MFFFDVEILMRAQPKTFFQMFCEFVIYSKLIFKSIINTDDTCQIEL